jgi:hypothetical protein
MPIKEHYEGFSDEQIEKYRREVRERWGEKILKDSEEVQELVVRWRNWLENFSHYSDEAVSGLGQTYSQHPEFAKFFEKYDAAFPEFFTRAIEHYCANKK